MTNQNIAMISMHTCPSAVLGGKKSGGMNVYVRELAKMLGARGHSIDIFTRLQTKCQPEIGTSLGPNVRVIHLEAGPFENLTTDQLVDHVDEFAKAIEKFSQNDSTKTYDLIHSHYWLSGLVSESLKQFWGGETPVVQMFHTLGHLKNRYAVDGQDVVSPKRLESEQQIVKSVDKIIAATPNEEAELIEYYSANPDAISVVPPGVDLEKFTPIEPGAAKEAMNIDCGEELLLFAGRIEKLKGIDTLLRAMEIVDTEQGPGSPKRCVVIVGGDPWAETPEPELFRLQQLTKELGIERHVDFVGAKDQDSLPFYYSAADVVVVPSHYESFGMVALEAMAMGKPVIASEVGGLASLIVDGENGIHVDSRDPEGLADAIQKVLDHPEFGSSLGENGRKFAQDFKWGSIAEQIEQVYSAVLS